MAAAKKVVLVGFVPADEDAGMEAREVAKKDELAQMQALVGGYVEVVRGPRGIEAYVNEEGTLRGLPINRRLSGLLGQPIVGDGFFPLNTAANKRLWKELME